MGRKNVIKSCVLVCDFCGKEQTEVKKLIAGPGFVCICDECVALCVEIIHEADVEKVGADETANGEAA